MITGIDIHAVLHRSYSNCFEVGRLLTSSIPAREAVFKQLRTWDRKTMIMNVNECSWPEVSFKKKNNPKSHLNVGRWEFTQWSCVYRTHQPIKRRHLVMQKTSFIASRNKRMGGKKSFLRSDIIHPKWPWKKKLRFDDDFGAKNVPVSKRADPVLPSSSMKTLLV